MATYFRLTSFNWIFAITARWATNTQSEIKVLIVDRFSSPSVEKTTQKV